MGTSPVLTVKTARNETIETCKMLAAIMVVFVHAEFPDHRGQLISCLGRFSVPVFFAFSGYFNAGASYAQVGRRLKRTLKLTLGASLLTALLQCLLAELSGWSAVIYLRSLFVDVWPEVLLQALVLHTNPFSIHLWYLSGLVACYWVLWVYTRFFGEEAPDYRYLFGLGAVLFLIYGTLSFLLPMGNRYLPCEIYRNGWLLGLPMFLVGMFLHSYQDRIVENFSMTASRQLLLIFGGLALAVLQMEGRPHYGDSPGGPAAGAGSGAVCSVPSQASSGRQMGPAAGRQLFLHFPGPVHHSPCAHEGL